MCIRDSLVEGGGQVLLDIPSISGSDTKTFCKPKGLRQVKVTVTGPVGTAWEYRIGCPDSPCTTPPPKIGPGSELSMLLERFFLYPDPNCDCKAKAEYMNRMGAQWCRENIETINGWLRDEAHKRGIPFFGWLGRQLILAAIDSWESKQMPLGQDGQT